MDLENGEWFVDEFIKNTSNTLNVLCSEQIQATARALYFTRIQKGRLFILGAGGSAGNASHAVNDFRKLTNIEAYAPTDNTSELTARVNDEGWETFFVNWLKTSQLNGTDAVLILSVGGGNVERNISAGLTHGAKYAQKQSSYVLGIVGRDGGDVAKIAQPCIIIPDLYPSLVTPITESLQSVVLHLLVSHPLLAENKTTW